MVPRSPNVLKIELTVNTGETKMRDIGVDVKTPEGEWDGDDNYGGKLGACFTSYSKCLILYYCNDILS